MITQTQLEISDLDGALETARASRDAEGHPILRPGVLRQVVRAQAIASSHVPSPWNGTGLLHPRCNALTSCSAPPKPRPRAQSGYPGATETVKVQQCHREG